MGMSLLYRYVCVCACVRACVRVFARVRVCMCALGRGDWKVPGYRALHLCGVSSFIGCWCVCSFLALARYV